jgi:hypothetical protein
MLAVESFVSVAVVESAVLKSLICIEPAVAEWIKCHSSRTHWPVAILLVVVPLFTVMSNIEIVPSVFNLSWRATLLAPYLPLTCTIVIIAAGLPLK